MFHCPSSLPPPFTSKELSSFSQSNARFVELDESFPENVEQSALDPEHSFVAVRRTAQTGFAKQKFAQSRTN